MSKLKITNEEYDKLVTETAQKSKSYKTIPMAFLFGGIICMIGQLCWDFYSYLGVDKEICPAAASCTLIIIAAALTGLKVFDDIAKHAGAGTLVPITGFANAVAAPALEYKTEGYILGVGAKMFTIAGPVIVYGVGASVIYGLIIYFFKL